MTASSLGAAFVSGAAGIGIGQAVARRLVRDGYAVAVGDIHAGRAPPSRPPFVTTIRVHLSWTSVSTLEIAPRFPPR